MTRSAVIWITPVVCAVLLVVWFYNGWRSDWAEDPMVSVLMDRGGTTWRLSRELESNPADASVDLVLAKLVAQKDRVDELGACWRDLEILHLLQPGTGIGLESLSRAIAIIRHPEFVDELTEKRIDAANTMGLLPSQIRTSALIRVLAEKREPLALRKAIVDALEARPEPHVVAALDKHWYSDSSRFQVARGDVASRGASLPMRRRSVAQLQTQDTVAADAALLEALADPDTEVRASAAFALKGREGIRIRDALIQLINPDEEYTVVYKALAAIEGCPNPEFVQALLATFNGNDNLQILVMSTLPICDDARIVGPIVESLDQRKSQLGFQAAIALASLAHKKHVSSVVPLQAALASKDIAVEDKAEISKALERIVGEAR